MAWLKAEENSNTREYDLHKSVSTVAFNKASPNLNLREARSFTGSLDELRNSQNYCRNGQHEGTGSDPMCDVQYAENGYVTKEVSSDQIFLVKDDMLTYRGKRYSLNDIATRWKKDCRMWLWKNKMGRKNKSVGELREKIQNLKLFNRPPVL